MKDIRADSPAAVRRRQLAGGGRRAALLEAPEQGGVRSAGGGTDLKNTGVVLSNGRGDRRRGSSVSQAKAGTGEGGGNGGTGRGGGGGGAGGWTAIGVGGDKGRDWGDGAVAGGGRRRMVDAGAEGGGGGGAEGRARKGLVGSTLLPALPRGNWNLAFAPGEVSSLSPGVRPLTFAAKKLSALTFFSCPSSPFLFFVGVERRSADFLSYSSKYYRFFV